MSYDPYHSSARGDSYGNYGNPSSPQQQFYGQSSPYNRPYTPNDGYRTSPQPPVHGQYDSEKYSMQDLSDTPVGTPYYGGGSSGYERHPTPNSSQYAPSSQFSGTPMREPQSMHGYGPSNRYADEEEFRDEGNGPTLANDAGYTSKANSPFRARVGGAAGSPTLSEAKLLVGPGSVKPRKARSCWDYTLCRCWPAWARWICCSCLVILLGLIIAVVVLIVTFKMPTVQFNGIDTQTNVPAFVSNGTSFSINFALKIGVVNDNIIGAGFQEIKASAFYPINHTPVGGGQLMNVNFPSHATTNLTFPFSIQYDPTVDKDQQILADIANRCGFLGNPKQNIVVDYTLTLYLKVLFVTIAPAIQQSTSIPCPIKDGQLPSIAQGAIPSGIPGISPTATASV